MAAKEASLANLSNSFCTWLVVLVTYYGTCLDFNFETITLRLGPSNMIASKLYSACFKPSKLAATNIFTEVMDRSNAAHINEKVIWMNVIHPNLRCRGWQDAPIFSKGRRQSRRTAADHVHEEHRADLSWDQTSTEKDEGNFKESDVEFYVNPCVFPGRHEPSCSPCTVVAAQANCSNITSSSRGVAEQIEGQPLETDTAFTEAHRMFLVGNLLSEGRSVPGDRFDALLPRPSIMKPPSGFGRARKRKVTEAGAVTENRVFRRKYLVTERSEEVDPKVSPSNTVPNAENSEFDVITTHRGNEMEENEFDPQVAGNYENLCEPADDVLLKTMGWFPVEEYPSEDNDPNRSARWILDEPPSVSDLPHLEGLLEISPSKFWSPESESEKRPPIRFGYLCRSESSQSSHSIQYFLNDSPSSSPEVATMFHHAPSVRISSKESSHRCSPDCPEFHGMVQNAPKSVRMRSEPMKASMKSSSLESDRKIAAEVSGVPEMSPAFSEDNSKRNTSRDLSVDPDRLGVGSEILEVQDYPHYQETGCVANLPAPESADLRFQRGKNLATDFLKVETTHEKIEARSIRNDTQHTDTIVQPSSTLWAQTENSALSLNATWERCFPKEKENSLLSSERQSLQGGDGNGLTERDSPLLRPLSSPLMFQHQLRGDRKCTRKVDGSLVALPGITNHPDMAMRLRNSLREKLASQVLFAKPVSESPSNEHLATVQCPKVAPDNLAWSATGIPRVSRKRSNRITKPKLMGMEVLNRFGIGEVAQPVIITPNKDYYTCKRRKSLTPRRVTFEELPTFSRNVKLRHLASAPTSDYDTDLSKIPMEEGTSPAKSPTLTRIVKPLRLMKTSLSKSKIHVRIKPILKSTVRKTLPTEPRKVNSLQCVEDLPVKHPAYASEVVLTCEKNPGVSGEAAQRQKVKEESSSKLSDCENSKIPALRSSKYRGVTRHRHTGRYEAHLWDNSRMKLGLAKRGTQVYLGAYPDEDQAAQAHDLAALKYWGPDAIINFPLSMYEEELKKVKNLTKEEYVIILRRRSPGFTRGISKYRGVTRHHQEGRWEARIGRHSGAKYHYLGTYDTQEEAAAAYDRAAVRHRGIKAITNFHISNYIKK